MSKPSERLLRYRPGIEALGHFFGDDALEAFMLFSLKELEFDSIFLSKIFNRQLDISQYSSPYHAMLYLTEQILGQSWQPMQLAVARRNGRSRLPRRMYEIVKGDLRLVYLVYHLPAIEGEELKIQEANIVVLPVKNG